MMSVSDFGSRRYGGLRLHRVAEDARFLRSGGAGRGTVPADVDVAVRLEVRMEGDVVGDAVVVEQFFGIAGVRIVLHAPDGRRRVGRTLGDEQQTIAAGLVGDGDGEVDREVRIDALDAIGRRRLGRADDARGRQRRHAVRCRAVWPCFSPGNRRNAAWRSPRGGGNRDAAAISAERRWTAPVPRNRRSNRSGTGRTSSVRRRRAGRRCAGNRVQGMRPSTDQPWSLSCQLLSVPRSWTLASMWKVAVALEALIAAGAAARQEHVHDRPGGVDLELVIARLVVGRLEEQLEDVVVPRLPVVLLDVGVEIGVLHVGEEIEIFAVPQQPGLRRRAWRRGPCRPARADRSCRWPGRASRRPRRPCRRS